MTDSTFQRGTGFQPVQPDYSGVLFAVFRLLSAFLFLGIPDRLRQDDLLLGTQVQHLAQRLPKNIKKVVIFCSAIGILLWMPVNCIDPIPAW